MGSFTSTKKIPKEDSQDADVIAELSAEFPDTVCAPTRQENGRDGSALLHTDASSSRNARKETWRKKLLARCQEELAQWPPLLARKWTKACHHHQSRNGEENMNGNGSEVDELADRMARTNLANDVGRRLSGEDPAGCDGDVDQKNGFRLMQWNVLSQSLGTARDSFVMCPPEALEWNQRRFRMLEEILLHKADILCFQEVDHYNFLEAHLAKLGYKGSFYAKPDSPCIYIPDNNGPDGCAMFYDASKFELVEEFTRVIQVWKVQSNQVVMVQILRVLETGVEFCVATTHLKAKDGALLATIRHEEGLDLVSFVKQCAAGRPVVVCGDFNAAPSEPVYAAMLRSGMKLGSAYAKPTSSSPSASPTEPEYTTWKVRADGEAKSTLDYVFYSKNNLSVDATLDFPTGDAMGDGRLPSLKYPSDHLSLVCDFSFKNTNADADVCDQQQSAQAASGVDESDLFVEKHR